MLSGRFLRSFLQLWNVVSFVTNAYYFKLYVVNHNRIHLNPFSSCFWSFSTGQQSTTMKLGTIITTAATCNFLPFSFSSCYSFYFSFSPPFLFNTLIFLIILLLSHHIYCYLLFCLSVLMTEKINSAQWLTFRFWNQDSKEK